MTIETIKSRLFGPAVTVTRMSLAEEVDAVVFARAGDERAFERLFSAHVPALRAEARRAAEKSGDADEVFGIVVMAVWESVLACGHGRGLGGVLRTNVREALNEYADSQGVVVIPRRVADRYRAVMRDAEGDHARALELIKAGGHRISREAFEAVHSTQGAGTLSLMLEDVVPVEPIWFDRRDVSTSRHLVYSALNVLDARERSVIECLFGFAEYRPLDVAETAAKLNMPAAHVNSCKREALAKMRTVLGA